MTDETYNGWTNRETWATALHLGNDQAIDNGARWAVKGSHYYEPTEGLDLTCKACGVDILTGKHATRPDDAIKDYVEHLRDLRDEDPPGLGADYRRTFRLMFDDIGSLWRVDWRAVAEAFTDEG